ncbi:glycine receptor subunit alpha-2-like [Tigriopus californicus]|nr:glycine receptor subunit alpha-2-like [Tigriopus californicus]
MGLVFVLFIVVGLKFENSGAICLGQGGKDKFEVANNYSVSDLPNRPVNVRLTFFISQVVDISDKKNELEVQGFFTLKWNDSRVSVTGQPESNGNVILAANCVHLLWTPDVWIQDLVSFGKHSIIGQLARLIIHKNKEIEYWQSVNLRLTCPMNLDKYPFDQQECMIRFSSNGLTNDLQTYEGSIQFSETAHLAQGALQYHMTLEPLQDNEYATQNCKNGAKCWPQIAAKLHLDRYFKNHALQVFIPTGCLVVLSWISFLIPPYIVPGRMVLLVTLLLVVFSTYASQHELAPQSSGVKIQDIWFLGCIVFILCAIFEYAICLFLKRSMTRIKRKKITKILEKQEKEQSKNRIFSIRQAPKNGSEFKPSLESKQVGDMSVSHNRDLLELLANPAQAVLRNPGQTDSGTSYGDVNDQNMEGEEILENIDHASLRLFPCAFAVYVIVFATVFLV